MLEQNDLPTKKANLNSKEVRSVKDLLRNRSSDANGFRKRPGNSKTVA
jgi:hypothetical protein